jgi:hypothetical protein
VYALIEYDEDGDGPNAPVLLVGGRFSAAGGVPVSNVARWNGANWSNVGGGTNEIVYAFTVFDEDAGGPNPPVLYAGGEFTTAGGVPANFVARWNGSSWSALGAGVSGGITFVSALRFYDADGSGLNPPALFVGGEFTSAGGVSANNIARWNLSNGTWSALGSGTSGFVDEIAVFDEDGAGPNLPMLFAVGAFSSAGGVTVNGIGRWNGTSWSALGTGLNCPAFSSAVFDEDGAGASPPALFACGCFTAAGGMAANHIARWNGSSWSSLGSGLTGASVQALTLTTYDADGSGAGSAPGALVVGGIFSSAGGVPVARIAQWIGCEEASVDVADPLAEAVARQPAIALGSPHPNPATGPFVIPFRLADQALVHLDITDATGRAVHPRSTFVYDRGDHELQIEPKLPPGVYFLRMSAGGVTGTRKFVVRNR